MRSSDYSDLQETYKPLDRTHMASLALVTGMFPQFDEREAYSGLVRRFSGLEKTERIDTLSDLLSSAKSASQRRFLDDLLGQVHYRNGIWQPLNYERLTDSGVIVPHEGDIGELVKELIRTRENKIVSTNTELVREDIDYLKHVKPQNKLVLNSKDVIRNFAERTGFELPEKYLENGRMTEEVYRLLEEHGFTFTEALKSAVDVMKTPKYKDRQISVFVIKRRNGDEVRIFPYDLIAGTELFFEAAHYRPEEFGLRHGSVHDDDFKYHGKNIFKIPKRTHLRGRKHNEVTTHYLPDVSRPRDMTLEWLSTVMDCNCDWGLNTGNFEIRRGRMTRTATTHDIHSRAVMLYLGEEGVLSEEDQEHPLMIYPTAAFIRHIDKFRNNLLVDGKYAGHMGINLLITEVFKLVPYEKLFTAQKPQEQSILRHLYQAN